MKLEDRNSKTDCVEHFDTNFNIQRKTKKCTAERCQREANLDSLSNSDSRYVRRGGGRKIILPSRFRHTPSIET